MTLSVLAVADSDSYLKWACATLDALRTAPETAGAHLTVMLLRTPIQPTVAQVAAATAATGVATPATVGLRGLRRALNRTRPDAVLVAATGPVAEVVARVVRAAHPGALLVSGLPGMALPARPDGVGYRRWTDLLVVHSHAERDAYAAAFAAQGRAPEVVVSRLPFLAPRPTTSPEVTPGAVPEPAPGPGVRHVVFAPQAKVPATRAQRVRVLDALARLARPDRDVVVKLRARGGERQTHAEQHPYDALWSAEHARLGHPRDALRFEDGPMARWLAPGSALVTISSTAALEAMAVGLPTAVVADFGVDDAMLNAVFRDSGCVVRLDDLAAALSRGGPVADPAWLRANYLHPERDELPGALHARTHAPRPTPARFEPWSRARHVRTVLRFAVPPAALRPAAAARLAVGRRSAGVRRAAR
ncbi:hypothetical protein CLV28_0157 [Sediminihabitans luteus]|uniref:CDP-glycerol:poly(Glycerophosphate) glycerophosphotransferase n=1 Tax=Sediminihabitans luteus TaxID=1138585 RepID=A0A2M9CYP0_9CELL|nr:DUF6716 putative glycosyltransferase [Sediminihabitans luteus]PJJ76945.1 hypothetical protein CLV28_0157 [Sediminihabitans luteus]